MITETGDEDGLYGTAPWFNGRTEIETPMLFKGITICSRNSLILIVNWGIHFIMSVFLRLVQAFNGPGGGGFWKALINEFIITFSVWGYLCIVIFSIIRLVGSPTKACNIVRMLRHLPNNFFNVKKKIFLWNMHMVLLLSVVVVAEGVTTVNMENRVT